MIFEHVALNMEEYETAAKWYCEHLYMQVVREKPGTMIFLGDEQGTIFFEIYSNKTAPVLDFESEHPLTLHLAFAVDDVKNEADRLLSAGCTVSDPYKEVAGDSMIMLRDPFGVSIQLVHRAK
jgi:catechol 2,3-dioxygenase-like lactoylglutathione lyase family enzyme